MAFLLFTIIIISLLAAALMNLNSQSSISNAHQVISARAFFAAESGAQLQALALFPVSGAAVADACTNPVTPHTFNVDGLKGCTAAITCADREINSVHYYQVVSTGQCNTGDDLQATRTIEVRLKDVL